MISFSISYKHTIIQVIQGSFHLLIGITQKQEVNNKID